MRRIISALLFCFSSACALAQDARPLELAPDAPDRHIVVPGDTLWGIASQFLKSPYRWPEIWRLNPDEIRNPQRIYPGQVILLDRSGEQPQLKLGEVFKATPRVYTEAGNQAIPAIPQSIIEPFLAQPLVVDDNALKNTARIIATQENRLYVGAGDAIYVTGTKPGVRHWQIYRPGKPLRNPENAEEILGLEAVHLGSARVVREGEPATMEMVSAGQEVGRDDLLIPSPPQDVLSYAPHAPAKKLHGRIMSLYGAVGEVASLSIVSLSAGRQDGLELGHVLAISRAGAQVNRRYEGKREEFRLPDEQYGTVFVFRVFDRVSYALVMNASRTVALGDIVETP